MCKGQVETSEEIHVVFAGREFVTIQPWSIAVHKKCSGILRKLKNDIDFPCKRSLEESPDQSSLLNEGEIEPNVKLECVSKFCYLGDMLGAGRRCEGGSKCQSEMFKEISPILMVRETMAYII